MSALSRTCLRLAACAALRGSTGAGENVFDTRLGELPSMDPQDALPVITVFTEEQAGDALSSQNGGPPFRTSVDLVVEIAMMVAQRDNDDAEFVLAYPSTSADLEAALDMLETQCGVALFESMVPHSRAFRMAFMRAEKMNSVRFSQVDAQDRVALRYLTISFEVVDDPLITFNGEATGLDALPSTFAKVAALWAEDAPERAVALALANALQQPSAPLLKVFRVNPANDPPASGPVENWTPPDPVTPAPLGGPPYSADWNMQP